jgi:hypothetical protein
MSATQPGGLRAGKSAVRRPPLTLSDVRARVLGVWLLAAVVGVGGGLGVGYLTQPRAASGGAATPLPASSPSIPVDPPVTQAPFAEDIDYPTLEPGLPLKTLLMRNTQQAWRVPYPKGWVASDVDTGELVPRKLWTTYDELRFRPPGEPQEGGYSLRVKMVNSRQTPAQMVAGKKLGLDQVDVLDYLGQTESTLKFTYRTTGNRLRYNYFAWYAASGSGSATLEMSVVGREQDVPGLDDLFSAFASTLDAVQ